MANGELTNILQMKKTIIFLSLITLLCLLTFSGSGQKNQSTLKILKKHTWVLQGINGVKVTYTYKSNHEISYWDGKPGRPFEFYLSNSKDEVFNKKNRTKNGKYIITRIIRKKGNYGPKPTNWVEIVKIDDENLVLKSRNNSMLKFKSE